MKYESQINNSATRIEVILSQKEFITGNTRTLVKEVNNCFSQLLLKHMDASSFHSRAVARFLLTISFESTIQ